MVLEDFYRKFIHSLELALDTKGWLWKLVACCVALSLFLSFPPYTLLLQHFSAHGAKLDAWSFIHNQAQDLFHPADYTLGVRREAMVFRWVLPLLYRLGGGSVLLILLLQFSLAVGFLYRLGDFCYRLFQNKVLTALVLLAISNTFVGVWGFADIHGYGDVIAFYFLLLALTSKNRILIFVAMLVAYFTDERAVVAGSYVLIFWAVSDFYAKGSSDLLSLIKSLFLGKSVAVWLAWFLYLGIRLYVKSHYFLEHQYTAVGSPVMFENIHRGGLGSSIWTAFEGIWLVLFAAILTLFLQGKRWVLAMFLSGFFVLLITGLYVHDIDRALGYGFPFILASLVILKNTSSQSVLYLLFFFVMTICVVHPQVFTMGYNEIIWLEPLPLKAFIFLSRYMGWNIFI